jgi:hypothetical protein
MLHLSPLYSNVKMCIFMGNFFSPPAMNEGGRAIDIYVQYMYIESEFAHFSPCHEIHPK